jgi:hypothetical protein
MTPRREGQVLRAGGHASVAATLARNNGAKARGQAVSKADCSAEQHSATAEKAARWIRQSQEPGG